MLRVQGVRVFAFPIFAFPFAFPNQNLPFVTDFWFHEIQSVAPLSVMFILFFFCPRFYNLKIFFPFLSHSTPWNHQLRHLFVRIFCDRHAPGMCFRWWRVSFAIKKRHHRQLVFIFWFCITRSSSAIYPLLFNLIIFDLAIFGYSFKVEQRDPFDSAVRSMILVSLTALLHPSK